MREILVIKVIKKVIQEMVGSHLIEGERAINS